MLNISVSCIVLSSISNRGGSDDVLSVFLFRFSVETPPTRCAQEFQNPKALPICYEVPRRQTMGDSVLAEDRALPSTVFGPLLLSAFCRLAANFAADIMGSPLSLTFTLRWATARSFKDKDYRFACKILKLQRKFSHAL